MLLAVFRLLGLLAGMGLLALILSRRATGFGTADNLAKLQTDIAFIAIATLGTMMLMIAGGIDLSIGPILAVAATCSALAVREGASVPVGVAVGVACGAALGALNGALSALTRLHPALVTLAAAFAYGGLSHAALGGYLTGDVPGGLRRVAEAQVLGVAASVWLAGGLAVAAAGVLHGLGVGRWLSARGLARRGGTSGCIRSRAYLIPWFALNGALVGLIGAFWAAEYGSIPAMWEGFDTQVFAAALLGGASLFGGAGSVVGAALAAGFVGLVYNGMVLVDAYDRFRWPVFGALIAAALLADLLARMLRRHR